jgi:signal transduction histidine kinase
MIGFHIPRSLIWWLPLGVLLALTLLLVAVEHELQARIDAALIMERTHVGCARTVREASETAYVGMLERWIRPPHERAERAKRVARDLEHLRSVTDDFVLLEPLSPIEADARARLVVALALFSNRVQKALINEDGPAAIEEIHEYTESIDYATKQVLTVDSAAGQARDTQMLVLRRKNSLAVAGVVTVGSGACILAFFWWHQKRRADRRYQAAESARREQVEAGRLRTSFYAHLSHELRTPIVVIQNLTSALQDSSSGAIGRRIRQAADELLHAINNVLDSSKLEVVGRASMRIESLDLGQVIRRSVHRCEGLVGDKAIAIVVQVPERLPPVDGDAVKLLQVVTNLVANAIRFTEHGCVRVVAFQSDERAVRIEVHDTGIGIAKEAITRIWQPFEQADDTVSSRFGGTGLGLFLVKTLVELHEGQVGVTSTPGVATCFWVTLPISRAAAAA